MSIVFAAVFPSFASVSIFDFLTDTSAISVRAKNPLQIVNKIMIQSSKNGKKLGLGSMGKDKIF